MWSQPLAVFDLETTGIDVTEARIVSAHISMIDPSGNVLGRDDWLADPGIEIPEMATAVHGITTERARAEGAPAVTVVEEILTVLRGVFGEGIPLVVYNAPYDLTLLNNEALRHGLEVIADPTPVIDPLVIDKALDRFRKGKRTLEAASAHYGVALTDAHDASADAIAAGRVAQAIARAHSAKIGALTPQELHAQQVSWAAEQAASFQEYMRRSKNPDFIASGDWPTK